MVSKKLPTESQEQQRFILKLRWKYPDILFFAVPNGGLRHKGEAARMKLEGVQKGAPDIFIAHPIKTDTQQYHGLFIEMKRQKGGVLSTAQKEMIEKLSSKGYAVEVCNGAEEAENALKCYLGLEPISDSA